MPNGINWTMSPQALVALSSKNFQFHCQVKTNPLIKSIRILMLVKTRKDHGHLCRMAQYKCCAADKYHAAHGEKAIPTGGRHDPCSP